MTNTFAWLDYSAQERKSMLEIVDLFREKGTVDELGLGVIRDAFADQVLPGTSTLQSRARYWLFVPWLYRQLEPSGHPPRGPTSGRVSFRRGWCKRSKPAANHRGSSALRREKVFGPPAALYWAGTSTLRHPDLSGGPSAVITLRTTVLRRNGGPKVRGRRNGGCRSRPRNWHPASRRAKRLSGPSRFKLCWVEADYLRERL